MRIAGRPLATLVRAPFQRRHYVAAANMLRIYENPTQMFGRYLLGTGEYPAVVRLRTPLGAVGLTVYSSHDVLTVNEIFCRHDYYADASDAVFVDFGSNIGISAAYFLTRGERGFAYLFEPLPRNVERLKENLRALEGRYSLEAAAVDVKEGQAQFGWEDTGRYGGVGLETGQYISVRTVDSNEVLARIVDKHGGIDVLKIDIETLEKQVVDRIPPELGRKIRRIYVEYPFRDNPLPRSHAYRQYGTVAQLCARSAPSV